MSTMSPEKQKLESISFASTIQMMNEGRRVEKENTIYKVHEVRNLTESAFIVRFDRNAMDFMAGQHLTLGLPDDNQVREYSIYSSVNVPYLEVLVKEVQNGLVSKRLRKLKQGDRVNVDGPFGFFTLNEEKLTDSKYLFVGTGTGLAPFHCLAGSYPQLDFKILHGVRFANEAYEQNLYPKDKYVLCTSRGTGDYRGRVTDYLRQNPVANDTIVYLCGNCDMIYEVYDLLTSRGMPSDQIKTEVYF